MNAITDCVVYCELREIRCAAGVWELFEETFDFTATGTVSSEEPVYAGSSLRQPCATAAVQSPSFTCRDRTLNWAQHNMNQANWNYAQVNLLTIYQGR